MVDIRPEPVAALETDSGPRHVVNLTAMRLVPAPQQPRRAGRAAPAAAADRHAHADARAPPP